MAYANGRSDPRMPAARVTERDVAASAVGGLVAGIALALLTALLSNSNIGGDGWSLSGNGALIVPFALGPAVLAAGWVMLALREAGNAAWLNGGLGAGGVALVLSLLANLAPISGLGGQAIWMI